MTAQLDAVLSSQTSVRDDHILVDLPFEDDVLGRLIGEVSVARSTIGTFVDKDDGLVKTAASNVSRFESDGLLIEGDSENFQFNSEEFDNASWNKTDVTVTPNTVIAPDGELTADTVNADTGGDDFISDGSSITASTNDYTYSLYIKAGTATQSDLAFSLGGSTTSKITWSGGIPSISNAIGTIEAISAGWFRWSVTRTNTSLSSAAIFIKPAGVSDTGSIQMWGAQLEELPLASSYIATTTIAVTREADIINIPFAENMPGLSEDVTWTFSLSVLSIALSVQSIVDTEGIFDEMFFRVTPTSTSFQHGPPGSTGAALVPKTVTKIAGVYTEASETSTLYLDDVLQSSGDGGPLGALAATSPIAFGGLTPSQTSFQMFGHIKNFRIYDVALTAEQVVDPDLAIENITVDFDLSIDSDGDILTDDFFDTAILYSLFGERRASASEVSEARLRRGWIGSEGAPFENGSKLWLLTQARVTRTILSRLEDEATKALDWMVTDGIAVAISDVTATVSNGTVGLNLTIERSNDKVERRFFQLWNNTGIR